jgi:hypothetical protein
MWQPRPAQWLVIWIAVFVGLLFETGLVEFGVPVLIGALLVWLLQRKSDKRRSHGSAR